jgi:hypothetical protein
VVRFEEKNRVHPAADRGQTLCQPFGLGHRSNGSVEDRATRSLGRRHRFTQDAQYHGVGNEIAPVHELLCFETERSALAQRGAE